MSACLFRKVTHLIPIRCASATNRSIAQRGWLVVGTQCMPRPLSPRGCGNAPRSMAVLVDGGAFGGASGGAASRAGRVTVSADGLGASSGGLAGEVGGFANGSEG